MTYSIFDKTAKGREEIATRKHHLSPRLRALLLLFDGKRPTEEVLEKVAGIGLDVQNIKELLLGGFIHREGDERFTTGPITISQTPTAQEAAINRMTSEKKDPDIPIDLILQALYDFYTESIRSTIGLSGYALQLKVERARTIDDFRKMRADYLNAVIKAQGEETARELDRKLVILLAQGNQA